MVRSASSGAGASTALVESRDDKLDAGERQSATAVTIAKDALIKRINHVIASEVISSAWGRARHGLRWVSRRFLEVFRCLSNLIRGCGGLLEPLVTFISKFPPNSQKLLVKYSKLSIKLSYSTWTAHFKPKTCVWLWSRSPELWRTSRLAQTRRSQLWTIYVSFPYPPLHVSHAHSSVRLHRAVDPLELEREVHTCQCQDKPPNAALVQLCTSQEPTPTAPHRGV